MIRSKPLKRRTPLRAKRPTKRAYKTPRCIYETPTGRQTCKRPQAHIERCGPHADAYLDGLVRQRVAQRPERCEVAHPAFACYGRLVVNHGIDRGEKSVRWDLRNVVRGCDGLNDWARFHKRQWYALFAKHVGPVVYADLERIADRPPKLDYRLIADALR